MRVYIAEYKRKEEYGSKVEQHRFYFCAENYFDAVEWAVDNVISEKPEAELTGVVLLDGVDIINFEFDNGCQCPFCRVATTVLDKIADFRCPQCDKRIRVAEDGWELIECPDCHQEIYRNLLTFSEGQWIYEKSS